MSPDTEHIMCEMTNTLPDVGLILCKICAKFDQTGVKFSWQELLGKRSYQMDRRRGKIVIYQHNLSSSGYLGSVQNMSIVRFLIFLIGGYKGSELSTYKVMSQNKKHIKTQHKS